jgi:hypothetical protein
MPVAGVPNMSDMRIKDLFFDRQIVIDAVDAATLRVLSKFGAFVMTRARQSIRTRKGASAPGSPPSSHIGTLKAGAFGIHFGFDLAARSVVIGPEPFPGAKYGPADAPPLLEYGGTAQRLHTSGKTFMALYRPRPFMGPAFEQEQQKMPDLWAGSVKR